MIVLCLFYRDPYEECGCRVLERIFLNRISAEKYIEEHTEIRKKENYDIDEMEVIK